MKRFFDLFLAFFIGVLLFIPMLLIAILVRLTSEGPVIFWSKRVGANNSTFYMPKFRSMLTNTPNVASHLLQNPNTFLSPIGSFLRGFSLDELPQLFSIIKGDMSFVGPRPALYNQDDLIKLRSQKGVHKLTPGVTGWAQINGRDELSMPNKVDLDLEYLHRKSFKFDLIILWMTFVKVIMRNNISH
jgi:O-antigen biosynthesis protein WbqP